MGDGDPDADQRTFRIDFSGEGLARLRGRIKEKLKDFLGDYTDDTLAEYVIVLLKNGRSKEAARKELNVFLEDDSVAFVSWLWDHLSSNMNFYVHNNQSLVDEAANVKSNLEGRSRRSSDWLDNSSGNVPMDSDEGRKGPVKTSSSRRNREWRGLSQAEISTTVLRSTRSDNISSEEKLINQHSPIKRSPSPMPHIHEKRKRQDEREMPKKDASSKPILRAPSRLLQFAVRDAVRTVQQAATKKEPTLKRLRSVVSASTMDQVTDTNRRTRSVVQVPGGIATALRAAAEAANDATRSRSSRNVFNRLGHGKDEVHVSKETSSPRVCMGQEEKYENLKHDHMSDDWYIERNEVDGESVVDTLMADEEARMTSDSSEEDDGYDHVNIPMLMAIDASQHKSISSAFQEKDTVMVKSGIAENMEAAARKSQVEEQDSPPASTQSAAHKVVNISVNVNTWKAPYYQPKEEIITETGNQMTAQKTETGERNLAASLPTESNLKLQKPVNDPTCSGVRKDAQKSVVSTAASYSTTSRPLEDAHSRTIFVSNVHFAATKDTLSRHFNKFGEVLKVVIITDAATGQSKGSAYVEFLRKESAELALSLNGTSFMSRILKVVRSSSYHEAAAMMSWPRGAWTSSYPSRIARLPFPRGVMGGAFRGRLPIKPGARSLQWKREAPTNPSNDASKNVQSTQSVGNTLASPTGRSLTYVRSEAKSDANSAPV